MTSIEKFDPSKLMEGVRDRIKATFISLIPDDRWDELVKTEVEKYFEIKDTWRNNDRNQSNFQTDCQSVLSQIAKEKINEYMLKHEKMIWENNIQKSDETFINLIKANAAEIFAATFSNMFQQAVLRMR